jgi:hypothetical protein
MHMISTIGLDVAKSVFQVHGVDAAGQSDETSAAGLWGCLMARNRFPKEKPGLCQWHHREGETSAGHL